jgi:hypothetical protein
MFLTSLFKKLASPITSRLSQTKSRLLREIEQSRILAAQPLIQTIKNNGKLENLANAEFKVFSQWGEDGIIQYLISKITIPNPFFVEFGVENYTEANTRFLLMNNNWSGLVMDSDQNNINQIVNSELHWRYDIAARKAFITRENINQLMQEAGVSGDIGLLSIDIDGNDYWIWDAISAEIISPRIVVVEYNSVFGKDLAITIPYMPDFARTTAHYSNLYYGASLKALYLLAQKKGYVFVGSNSAGNNAFFIRKDVSNSFRECSLESGYVESKFRESRDKTGKLSFAKSKARLDMLNGQTVYDIEKDKLVKL